MLQCAPPISDPQVVKRHMAEACKQTGVTSSDYAVAQKYICVYITVSFGGTCTESEVFPAPVVRIKLCHNLLST
jgi:hypothetical protein